MQFVGIRVKNYRTIGAAEQFLNLSRPLTIVGPNNSGKTNLLKALQVFFTGHENDLAYDVALDAPDGSQSVRTSLVGTFEGNDIDPTHEDAPIYQALDKLFGLYGLERSSSAFPLYLSFSPSSTPIYAFFPNQKRPGDKGQQASISRIQRQLVSDLLDQFECHYIPSAKSINELFQEVLSPFMKAAVVRVLQPQLVAVKNELAKVAGDVTSNLGAAGIENLQASFDFQGGSIEQALSGFDFFMEDPFRTRLERKGQGVQSAAFMASLLWVTKEETERKKSSIWLMEEPESYLHPGLTPVAISLMDKLAKAALLVATTHSMAFVPQDPKSVVGTKTENGRTIVTAFASHLKATESIRKGLGVAFSDYFSLGERTVFVEGQTDADLMRWFLAASDEEDGCDWPLLRSSSFSDRGGSSHLAGFLRANYSLIRAERVAVSLLDGDDAGVKAIKDLTGYFGGMSESFNSNAEYVLIRKGFAIEGLFPDGWIVDIHSEKPDWFKEFIVDGGGTLMSFAIKTSKDNVINKLKSRAEVEKFESWSGEWRVTCDALEGALAAQEIKVHGAAVST